MPSSRHVRWMRRAISPRFAISSLWIAFTAVVTPFAFGSLRASLALHPEHAELARAGDVVRERGGERDAEGGAAVAGVEHAVVEQATARELHPRLALDLVLGGGAALRVGRLVEGPARRGGRLARHDRQRARELLGAHHGGLRVRPQEQEARLVRAATHAVVARA